jgi:hypothetical protein
MKMDDRRYKLTDTNHNGHDVLLLCYFFVGLYLYIYLFMCLFAYVLGFWNRSAIFNTRGILPFTVLSVKRSDSHKSIVPRVSNRDFDWFILHMLLQMNSLKKANNDVKTRLSRQLSRIGQ